MLEVAALLALVLAVLFWLDSLRARERAVRAGREACQRYELQFLDDTVSFARLRLERDDEGRVRIARTYAFEFTETGNSRRRGAIKMLGKELSEVQLDPYEMA